MVTTLKLYVIIYLIILSKYNVDNAICIIYYYWLIIKYVYVLILIIL